MDCEDFEEKMILKHEVSFQLSLFWRIGGRTGTYFVGGWVIHFWLVKGDWELCRHFKARDLTHCPHSWLLIRLASIDVTSLAHQVSFKTKTPQCKSPREKQPTSWIQRAGKRFSEDGELLSFPDCSVSLQSTLKSGWGKYTIKDVCSFSPLHIYVSFFSGSGFCGFFWFYLNVCWSPTLDESFRKEHLLAFLCYLFQCPCPMQTHGTPAPALMEQCRREGHLNAGVC